MVVIKMTVKEIVDILNFNNSGEIFSFCYKLDELIDNENNNEAIVCIKERFNCNQEIANSVLIEYKKQVYDEIKKYKDENPLTPQQIAHANAVAEEWQNKPKCPTCQSTNIKKVSGTSKAISVAMFGLFSQKVKKQFHCNNCDYEW